MIPGGLAVGVRLPGVHRREPHLRPVADDEEDEARPGARAGTGRSRARAGPPKRRLSSPEAPWSAAYATKSEPRSASAIPTDPIMRYFHAASSERAFWLK